MQYTDEQKRSFCVSMIIEHLNTLDTWEKFISFLNNITKAKLKAKLIKGYQDAQVEGDLLIGSTQEKKAKDEAMANEIEETF